MNESLTTIPIIHDSLIENDEKSLISLIALVSSNVALAQTPARPDSTAAPAQEIPDRAMPAPLNSLPFPSGDWVGTFKIGARSDAPDYALQKVLGMANNKSRIKIYGWINPSVTDRFVLAITA